MVTTTGAMVRAITGAVPAAMIVLGVLLLALLGIMLPTPRRRYVLEIVDRMVTLAGLLVGIQAAKP